MVAIDWSTCIVCRVIQESGVKTSFPIYVVGVFSGEQMISEGKE